MRGSNKNKREQQGKKSGHTNKYIRIKSAKTGANLVFLFFIAGSSGL